MKRIVLIITLLGALVIASPSFAGHTGPSDFPSSNPNVRLNTPDDPDFDCAEPDDEDPSAPNCSSVYEEQFNLFGFPPNSTEVSATYHDTAHAGQGQISGIAADRAWKTTIGHPDVAIAIVDTGIEWNDAELRQQIWLNQGELPLPQLADNSTASSYDANGDGAFTVEDYANDSRVDKNLGPNGVSGKVDGQDLIRSAFIANEIDDDGNGYVDDIVGWDFFDDDNDPFDASSYSSADGHGSGRAKDAARDTDNGASGAGVCPQCRIMVLRLWDSFVAPADTYAMAAIYAADNGADVLEAALGVLQNSRFAQAATQYAFESGVVLTQVSSDLNTADHNYPTNYNNTIFVAGSVADAHGLGENNAQFGAFLQQFNIPAGSQVPVGTWFRNSGLTQYGGHAAIVTTATTGSEATGQASGAAGLIKSRGLELAATIGGPLTSNEVKQLLTLTAEDVLLENTAGAGAPDYAQPGWDQHFGYGRVDLGRAMTCPVSPASAVCIADDQIPPEAGIETPAWFMPLDPVTTPNVTIGGFASANRAPVIPGPSRRYTYEVAYAPGLEPLEELFVPFAGGSGTGPLDGSLGTLPLATVATLLPGAAQGVPPLDPHQYAFTVRLQVTDTLGNVGEDRKVFFAYHDATLHAGWPKFVDTGGEQSLRFADLDGNGALEIVAANTTGEISVYNHNGTVASYFNGGQPYLGPTPSVVQNHLAASGFTTAGLGTSHGGFSTPAIGDLDGDGYQEIVAANGDRVFALRGDGTLLAGFPVAINPAFSAPSVRTKTNHLKTAIFSSPVISDLDLDGRLDIIVVAMDQRAYAWDMDGDLLTGWPVFLSSGGGGAESINTPAVADITGDGYPEVIVATNEIFEADFPSGVEDGIVAIIGQIAGASGQISPDSSRLYAIHHDGTAHDGNPDGNGGLVADPDAFLPGWPKSLTTLDGELLPLVEPGVDAIIADVDPTTAGPEVINGAFAGDLTVIDDDASSLYIFQSSAGGGSCACPGLVIQAAEHSAVGDVTGTGQLSLFKGGIPVEQLVNLLLVGQNVPYQHPIQGWDAATGVSLPGWPRAMDDYQLFISPAIADVGGTADREIIQGSGLYLLHAFELSGAELPGFPKFTGGWISSTVPVGDIDNDGLLEIAMWTREGNMFVWDTEGPACGGNDEWWGFRHDEHNSGFYGNDTRPPRVISNLGLDPGADTLNWTAPGDDHACGTATTYDARYSSAPITRDNWASATPVTGEPGPTAGDSLQNMSLPVLTSGSYYYAIRTVDEAGNLSPLSNVLLVCVRADGSVGPPSTPPWPIPADDSDFDGWSNSREDFLGTARCSDCAATSAINDEAIDSAPTDNNDDRLTSLADVIRYIPVFSSPTPNPNYQARFDLSGNARISLQDIILFIPFFNKPCPS